MDTHPVNYTLRIASLDEIRNREAAIWSDNFAYGRTSVSPETKRKLRAPYQMAESLTYGFVPLVWDNPTRGWLFSRRAMCLTCGHVVATNQPSWMRKHATEKHRLGPSFGSLVALLHDDAQDLVR